MIDATKESIPRLSDEIERLLPRIGALPPDDLRMWIDKKRKSSALAEAYAEIGGPFKRLSERVRDCAPELQRIGSGHPSGEGLRIKTIFAGTCKARLCPLCATLRARRQYAKVVPRFNAVLHSHGVRAAFATFTVPNVALDQGKTAGAEIIAGFRRMTQRKDFKKAVVGWMRALEVTFNAETNQLHPHLHVVLLLHRNYYSKQHDLYLSQEEWLELWRKVMRNQSIKVFDVRRLRPKKKGLPLSSALGEVTKYPMKPAKIFIRTDDGYTVDPALLEPLHMALRAKRLFGFGGVLRKAALAIDDDIMTDPEWMLSDEDLDAMLRAPDPEPLFAENYVWVGGNYVEDRVIKGALRYAVLRKRR